MTIFVTFLASKNNVILVREKIIYIRKDFHVVTQSFNFWSRKKSILVPIFFWNGENHFGTIKEALLWLWKFRILISPQRRQLKKWQIIHLTAFLVTDFWAFFSGYFSDLFGTTCLTFKLNACNNAICANFVVMNLWLWTKNLFNW